MRQMLTLMLRERSVAVDWSVDAAARSRDVFQPVIKIYCSFIHKASFMLVSHTLTFGV